MKKKQENFFKKYRGVGYAIAFGGVPGLMGYGIYKGLQRLRKKKQ